MESVEDLVFRLALYRQAKEDAAWLRERWEAYRIARANVWRPGEGTRLRVRPSQTRLPLRDLI